MQIKTFTHGNIHSRVRAGHRTWLCGLLVLGTFVPAAAFAFECTNNGAGSVAPVDSDEQTNTACGTSAVASSGTINNTAVGFLAGATGNSDSTALGWTAQASATNATALGAGSSASDSNSMAVGASAEANGLNAVAVGTFATAVANSTALGTGADAESEDSVALGNGSSAEGHFSTAVGDSARAVQDHSMVLGTIPGFSTSEYTDVAIGTMFPQAPLHIARESLDSSSNAQVLVDNIDQATAEPRSMFELINNGPIGFNMENVDTGQRWRFAAQTTGFRISLAGTGGPEFEVRENGNAVLAGNLFTNSDVNAKQDIVPVAGASVLEKLERLPVSEWSYKDATGTRHLGPMAQDFHAAFGLGPNDTSIAPMDLAGVSLAAVKALKAENEAVKARHERAIAEKDTEIAELRTSFMDLQEQIQQMQASLSELDQLKVQLAAIQAQLPQWVALGD